MVKITQKKLIKKKKNWIAVYGSNLFENLYLGESLGEKPGELMNRVIEANLGDITRDIKKQNIKLYFKVNDVKENRVMADVIRYEIMNSYLRRNVRKMKNKMDDSFRCKTKDGIEVQIKPLMMTKSNAQKSLLSVIRVKSREILVNEIANMSYNETMDAIANYRLQKMLRERIKKISPLAVCDIRMLERLS